MLRVQRFVLLFKAHRVTEQLSNLRAQLLVTDKDARAHVNTLMSELNTGFKKLNNEINAIEYIPGDEDPQMRRLVKQKMAQALMRLSQKTSFLDMDIRSLEGDVYVDSVEVLGRQNRLCLG
jgi:hypothetical protein